MKSNEGLREKDEGQHAGREHRDLIVPAHHMASLVQEEILPHLRRCIEHTTIDIKAA
jgi:hypothetical protein